MGFIIDGKDLYESIATGPQGTHGTMGTRGSMGSMGSAGGQYNPSPNDHAYNGEIETITAGETLGIMNVGYLKSDGKYWKTKADSASTSVGQLRLGVGTINTNSTGTVLIKGYLRDDSIATKTVGGNLYLSVATKGAFNQTAPSSSGNQVRIIGTATGTKVVYFNPDNTYIEI